MNVELMRAKIHRATVTEADLQYEGSISICPQLIEAAAFFIHERVDIYNCNTGARFSTYVIKGKSIGEICLNGAAARLVQKGDIVIIASYAHYSPEEAARHQPRVVFVDEKNGIKNQRIEEAGRKNSIA